MALAHEIAVNSDFKLEAYDPPANSIEKIVKETIHKAFWNILRTQLESDPPVYDHALVLLGDIKEAFQAILLENNQKTMVRINEWLDEDLVISSFFYRKSFIIILYFPIYRSVSKQSKEVLILKHIPTLLFM